MNLRIRLGLLDQLESFGYEKSAPIYLGNNYVGQCEVMREVNGKHYGILELKEHLNHDLFLYYTNWHAMHSGFWFSGIQLTHELLPNTSTPQIKDVIF
jgi:hypothetical protein